jgi:predicted Fe-Mo cluster-binding NifX family protein
MKIVIPTDGQKGLNETVAQHFGRSLTYTFLNEKGEVIEIIKNTSEHMGGQGLPPELMRLHGASVLLCHDLGPKALNLCEEYGINVYTSQAEIVKDIFAMWRDDKLKKAGEGDACERHK